MGKTTNQILKALRRTLGGRTVFILFHDAAPRDAAVERCREVLAGARVSFNFRAAADVPAFDLVRGGRIAFPLLERVGDQYVEPTISALVSSAFLRPLCDLWLDHYAEYLIDRQRRRSTVNAV